MILPSYDAALHAIYNQNVSARHAALADYYRSQGTIDKAEHHQSMARFYHECAWVHLRSLLRGL